MKHILRQLFLLISFFCLVSCSSFLNYKKEKAMFKNAEFEKKVTIIETEEVKPAEEQPTTPVLGALPTDNKSNVSPKTSSEGASALAPAEQKPVDKSKNKRVSTPVARKNPKGKNSNTAAKQTQTEEAATSASDDKTKTVVNSRRQPDIENSDGFVGNSRRPPEDPFRVGEIVKHDVSYLGASAGTLTLKVGPFAVVNGRKSYNFNIDLKSNSFFTRIFAVDDQVQTFVDYENLVPHVFKLNIRDSGQVKEAQAYFDNESLRADYWEHRYTEKHGHEEKKMSWTMLPYSQNAFSSIFYMRVFKFTDGKEYSFRVADDEKNVLFKAKVVGREKLKTAAGTYSAVKIKAEVYSRGNLAKASDFFMWLSDDDRKYLLRIEVKLPIGSLVSEAIEIQPGRP